jgi:hypothetical protein
MPRRRLLSRLLLAQRTEQRASPGARAGTASSGSAGAAAVQSEAGELGAACGGTQQPPAGPAALLSSIMPPPLTRRPHPLMAAALVLEQLRSVLVCYRRQRVQLFTNYGSVLPFVLPKSYR